MPAEMSGTDERLGRSILEFRRLESNSKRAFEQMAHTLTPPFRPAARHCEEQRAAVVKCHETNLADTFHCDESVRAFSTCARQLYARHLELVDNFRALRDEHLRQEQQRNAQ